MYLTQSKDHEHARQRAGDGSKSANHVTDAGDNATSNSTSIPSSTIDNDVAAHMPLNANGRTLVHRHGLANGMPAQVE